MSLPPVFWNRKSYLWKEATKTNEKKMLANNCHKSPEPYLGQATAQRCSRAHRQTRQPHANIMWGDYYTGALKQSNMNKPLGHQFVHFTLTFKTHYWVLKLTVKLSYERQSDPNTTPSNSYTWFLPALRSAKVRLCHILWILSNLYTKNSLRCACFHQKKLNSLNLCTSLSMLKYFG